jgi:hypothetical protein
MRIHDSQQINQHPAKPVQPHDRPHVKRLSRFKWVASCGILAVFIAAASLNNFSSMWRVPSTPSETVHFAARAILFLTLTVLAVRWVIATKFELNLWLRWLDNPVQKRQVYAAIIALSLMLGFCLAFAHNIVVITLIFTIFLLLNYWTQWLSNDHIARALSRTRERSMDNIQRSVLCIMENYWLERPQLARITTLMFFSSMTFSLALCGAVQKDPQKLYRFHLAATILLVITILVGEIVLAWWRHLRQKQINHAIESKSSIPSKKIKEQLATKAHAGDLKGFSTNAYFGIFAVALGIASINNFRSSMFVIPSTDGLQFWVFVASGVFFFELLALSYLWIHATGHELNLWIKWLKNPVDKQQVRLAIISLALVLGVALAFAYNIVFISGFMAIYLLVNYWTQWLADDHFVRALQQTRVDTLSFSRRRVLDVMEEYWVARPQLGRITSLMYFASLGFSLALAGFVQEDPWRHRLYLASYIILFLDILFGEIVIFKWRYERNRGIAQAAQATE